MKIDDKTRDTKTKNLVIIMINLKFNFSFIDKFNNIINLIFD